MRFKELDEQEISKRVVSTKITGDSLFRFVKILPTDVKHSNLLY